MPASRLGVLEEIAGNQWPLKALSLAHSKEPKISGQCYKVAY